MILAFIKNGMVYNICKECLPKVRKYRSKCPIRVFGTEDYRYHTFSESWALEMGIPVHKFQHGNGIFTIKNRKIKSDTKPDKI